MHSLLTHQRRTKKNEEVGGLLAPNHPSFCINLRPVRLLCVSACHFACLLRDSASFLSSVRTEAVPQCATMADADDFCFSARRQLTCAACSAAADAPPAPRRRRGRSVWRNMHCRLRAATEVLRGQACASSASAFSTARCGVATSRPHVRVLRCGARARAARCANTLKPRAQLTAAGCPPDAPACAFAMQTWRS